MSLILFVLGGCVWVALVDFVVMYGPWTWLRYTFVGSTLAALAQLLVPVVLFAAYQELA